MDFKDKVVVITALDPKVASHREELIRSQQGELNAVLISMPTLKRH